MSQSTDTTSQTSTGTDVLAEVAAALKASAQEVKGRVVKTLSEKEISKRVDLLLKGLEKKTSLQNELSGVRPPSKKTFALVDGKMVEVQSVYTPDEVKKFNEETKQYNKKLKEATEKLAKFSKLLDSCFGLGDGDAEKLVENFTKLAKAVGGGSIDDDEKKDEE